jgi:hypothetical protein
MHIDIERWINQCAEMNKRYFLAGRFQYYSLYSMTRMSKKAKINDPFTLSQEGAKLVKLRYLSYTTRP